MHILGEMDKVLAKPNELTGLAPYFCKFKDKVKVVINKIGSTIKGCKRSLVLLSNFKIQVK